MSRTYKTFANSSNINELWNVSLTDQRKKLLRSVGICDKDLIKHLVNNKYVELDPDVRFKLECQ